MAPLPSKHVTRNVRVKKSEKLKKAASTSPSDHTIPRKKRQLKAALSTLNSSPAQNLLDSQLHYDMLSAEPEPPSKNSQRPGPQVYEEVVDTNHISDSLSGKHRKKAREFYQNPSNRPSTDVEFKRHYLAIQDMAWEWAERFFKEDPSQPLASSDLGRLATEFPELMEYINMTTSCAPTDTWEQAIHFKQAEIAFSILGKVLEVHVFGEELFGASTSQRKKLQKTDAKMMDSDGTTISLLSS